MGNRGAAGLVCLALGVLCLTGAFGLYQSNRSEAREAEAAAAAVMEQLAPAICERAADRPPVDLDFRSALSEAMPIDPTMPCVEIGGNRYVGFLTIPDLALELPVMEDWDYEKLKTAPCRYTGTLLEHDLTIAAHNYLRHFGHLMDLKLGAEVLFTDAVGETTRFNVAELEILPPDAVDRLTAGEYDLTLFTCTYGGATRFTVRCLRAE